MENSSLDAAVTLTEKDRQKIGKQIYEEILRSNDISDLKKVRTEIVYILKKLTDALEPRERRRFNLIILETPEVNAYTTLGGYIYLTTGLIKFVNTPDELAFILGHEIGHDVELHTQRKVAKVMISSNFLENVNLQDYTKVAMNISTRFSAPFDQIDEYEADKFGALLAQKAGYDPERFGDFFIKIRNSRNSSLIDKLLSTHPFPEHRQKCINEYISEK
ncbi:MAG TPA: M48 family metallopeptidase [Salinimicrobium sp.]|nr:M48 family metallopeptidase [Salinimicrobium sp.]